MDTPNMNQVGKQLQISNRQPAEIISRGSNGEVLAPFQLPPELAKLSLKWEKLTYDQKLADIRKCPVKERLRLLQSIGGICKNAVDLVREFRPLIESLRDEFRRPGRRVPVEGQPTWSEFVHANFGFTPRRFQQLLAKGNPSEAAPGTPGPRRAKIKAQARSHEKAEQLALLAVRLAKKLVEHGLADRFPEAAEILKLVNRDRKPQSLARGPIAPTRSTSAVRTQEPKQVSPSTRVETKAAAKAVTTAAPVNSDALRPRPNCFICETGIFTCAMHEPQVRALMAVRGIDEHEASLILREQFAKLRRSVA